MRQDETIYPSITMYNTYFRQYTVLYIVKCGENLFQAKLN